PDRDAHAWEGPAGSVQVSFRHEYQKLIAADSGDAICPARVPAQEVRGCADQTIPGLVTVAVVHRFEVVEVSAHDRHRARVPNPPRFLARHVIIPRGAVLEAR